VSGLLREQRGKARRDWHKSPQNLGKSGASAYIFGIWRCLIRGGFERGGAATVTESIS
jgi:hypothetical protein